MRRARPWTSARAHAILAFCILAFQIWLPWSVPRLVTEDGPSHLYTAVAARELIFHPHSDFAKVYRFNHRVVPNWGTTITFGVIASVFGVTHAEQVFMTFALAAGFLSFAYAIRSFAPHAPRWTPLANFLLQTWFLWLGFYNFYLAMILCPLVIGYYVRHASALTTKKAVVLACGMTALFLTHLIPAVIAGLAIFVIALRLNVRPPFGIAARKLLPIALAFIPAVILFAWFARGGREHTEFKSDFVSALENFPMHVFATSSGRAGNQHLLYPAVLCLIAIAVLAMRRMEWRTARGGLATSTVLVFVVYLFAPDAGLGGKEAKIRFVWGVFILGGLLVAASPRLRPLRLPLDIYIFVLLIANLTSTLQTLWNYDDAVEDYLAAIPVIPRGSHIVRVRYPTPDVPERYRYQDIGRDPLFHLDSYIAVQCRCLDLTDYQAPNKIFPVVFNRSITEVQAAALWSFEWPGPDMDQVLAGLESSLPVAIDYVIVLADPSSPGAAALFARLDSEMRRVGTSAGKPFVRVYQRR